MSEVASPLLRVMWGSFLDLRASRSSISGSGTGTVEEGAMVVNFLFYFGESSFGSDLGLLKIDHSTQLRMI